MGRTGLFLLLVSFIGIPAFFVSGLSRNIALGILAHVAVMGLIIMIARIRCGSFRNAWLSLNPASARYSPHPSAALLAGLIFLAAGIFAFFAQPGNEENSMSLGDQIYFGGVFVGIGAGICMMSGEAWLLLAREKRRNAFVSGRK